MHAIFTPKLIVSYPDLDFILAYPMFKNVPYVRLTVNLPCWNLSVQAKKTIPSDTLDSVGKYYAVYYTGPRFTYYCMGNENIKTFNDDDEGPVTKVEIDCLKKNQVTQRSGHWPWEQKKTFDSGQRLRILWTRGTYLWWRKTFLDLQMIWLFLVWKLLKRNWRQIHRYHIILVRVMI